MGTQVLQQMMEIDRIALCGPAGQHDPERQAGRAGSTTSPIVLGGCRLPIRRPRVRSPDGELSLPSFEAAAREDPLNRSTLAAIAAGASMRRYGRMLEPAGGDTPERAPSRSAVSRRFVALTVEQLASVFSQPLHELDLQVVILDGILFRDPCVLLAVGIDTDGKKHALGLWEGTSENTAVAKALRKAIRDVFGGLALVQRCQLHKRRNVLEHLPQAARPNVAWALGQAWQASRADLARKQLQRLARSLETQHPGAAASLREGLEETLTLQGLGIEGALYRTLCTTNVIENLNSSVATYTRNVKRWRGGEMILRWVGAAVIEARARFRRIRGHRDMRKLVQALQQHGRKHGVGREEQAA